MKKIMISNRVDLYISDKGFQFTNQLKRPRYLEKWDNWNYFWPLYTNDNIQNNTALQMSNIRKYTNWK